MIVKCSLLWERIVMATAVFLLEVFGARAFGGNIAGVVLLESRAPHEWMLAVAAELGAPTTGFVHVPSARRGIADVRLFTPRQEIRACGHVTVAVAVILREEGIWSAGPAEVTTLGGRFSLTLGRSDACPTVEMMQQLQQLDTLRVDSAALRALLGSGRHVTSASAVIAGTGLRHLLIPVGGAGDLACLPMNPQVIEAVSSEFGVDTIGVYAVTQVGDRVVEVRMRDLCAGIGAVEEAASGTTTGTLALVLADGGILTQARPRLEVTMGVEMGRPSWLVADVDFDRGQPVSVRLQGRARRVLSGVLDVRGGTNVS
jgi:PhzF family phenazine biosynthesis protein